MVKCKIINAKDIRWFVLSKYHDSVKISEVVISAVQEKAGGKNSNTRKALNSVSCLRNIRALGIGS